jgi:hypothetical protein
MVPPSTLQVDIGPQAYGKDSTLGANSAKRKAPEGAFFLAAVMAYT